MEAWLSGVVATTTTSTVSSVSRSVHNPTTRAPWASASRRAASEQASVTDRTAIPGMEAVAPTRKVAKPPAPTTPRPSTGAAQVPSVIP